MGSLGSTEDSPTDENPRLGTGDRYADLYRGNGHVRTGVVRFIGCTVRLRCQPWVCGCGLVSRIQIDCRVRRSRLAANEKVGDQPDQGNTPQSSLS